MKKWNKLMVLTLATSMLFAGCAGGQSGNVDSSSEDKKSDQSQEASDDIVTINVLRAWNGSSSNAPDAKLDIVNEYLREHFGAEIEWDFVQGSEVEKLNLLFASGDMPDIIDFPFWGGNGGESGIVKRAAADGLLKPIDDYMKEYSPKLFEKMYKGCTQDYIEFDLNAKEFGGKHYIIPRETVSDPVANTQNFAYGLYIRGDIAKDLGIDASDPNFLKDADDVYTLLNSIKEKGYKDVNGNPVIPASAGARGWMHGLYLNEWYDGGITEFYKDADGTLKLDIMKEEDENATVLFMRKLVSEGLFDKEIFSQENAELETKIANGSIGVISYSNSIYDMTDRTLAKAHPEMDYVPLPMVPNKQGDRVSSANTVMEGRSGSPAFAITSSAEDIEVQKFLEILEFINSTPEGYNLVNYGIEGKTFEMVDGVPQFLPEVQAKADEDFTNITKMGIGANYSTFVIADEKPYGIKVTSNIEEKKLAAGDVLPLVFVDGIRSSKYTSNYPDVQGISMMMTDYSNVRQSAYFAESDEKAIEILDKYRKKTQKQLDDYTAFVQKEIEAANKSDILY